MSREEDLIRSTTRALASVIHDVPTLRLDLTTDELGGSPVAPHRPSRWRSWGVPLTAAAAVVALGVSLTVARNISSAQSAPGNHAAGTSAGSAGVDGAPRYYVALQRYSGEPMMGSEQDEIVVGDSLTGKILSTFAPPARTTYQLVTGAADDRTFVVEAVHSSTGDFAKPQSSSVTITDSWFGLHLAPGAGQPARLVPSAIAPQSWTVRGTQKVTSRAVSVSSLALPMALSQSGQALAIGEGNPLGGGTGAELKVFSVGTGQVLHDWTTTNQSMSTAPWQEPTALTWIDEDRALEVAFVNAGDQPYVEEFLRLNAVGSASGDLLADSTEIASWPEAGNSKSCFAQDAWVPYVTADGHAAVCSYDTMVGKSSWEITFRTDTVGSSVPDAATIDYQFTQSAKNLFISGTLGEVQWADPTGKTLIGEWGAPGLVNPVTHRQLPDGPALIGVISHGKFTPLHVPTNTTKADGIQSGLFDVTW